MQPDMVIFAPECFIARSANATRLFDTESEASKAIENSGGSIYASRPNGIELVRTIPPRLIKSNSPRPRPMFVAQFLDGREQHFEDQGEARETLMDREGGVLYVSKTTDS